MPDIRQFAASSTARFRAPWPRSSEPELMDANIEDVAELAGNFRDIQRVNSLLGGTAIVLRHLPPLMASLPPGRVTTILDLGTGCGDIPVAIARWAKRRTLAVSILASDVSPQMLDLARAQCAAYPEITLSQEDARAVSLPDAAVDIVLCSLSLHHFEPDDAVQVLAEMRRLARAGFIVNDLKRGRLGYGAAWLASRLTTRNRLTRNDAPLSVRRAYTPPELDALLGRAGIADASISTHPWFRMAAVAMKERA